MQNSTRIPLPRTAFTRYMSVALGEARDLFHRRKISYALLAVMLIVGAVYAASTARPMVVGKGAPSSSTSDASGPAQTNNQGSGDMSSNTSQSATSGDASNSTSMQSTVTVNGQNIEVPENGSIHTTLPGNSGQTSVDITHQSWGGGNSSSLNVQVESQSESDGNAPSD